MKSIIRYVLFFLGVSMIIGLFNMAANPQVHEVVIIKYYEGGVGKFSDQIVITTGEVIELPKFGGGDH